MQPLLPEKESGNGTGATSLAQAKDMTTGQPGFAGKRHRLHGSASREHSPEQRFSLPFVFARYSVRAERSSF
jgi:hypothetical protein